MNGIKMSECKFYVDEDARVVVCVIPDTQDMVIDFIYDHFDYSDISLYDSINWNTRQKLRMPNSFSGKAVCAAEDTWDEALGRKIAFSRAKEKCYKSFFKRANAFIQTVDRRLGHAIELFNDFGLKLQARQETLEKEIDERLEQ